MRDLLNTLIKKFKYHHNTLLPWYIYVKINVDIKDQMFWQ